MMENKNMELNFNGFRIESGMTMCGEDGRSMVEMLGVLAVIGVLSVAGIAGYNNAMNRYRANEILNEASKRATVIAAQFMTRDTASLTEFTNNDLGYAKFAGGTVEKNANNQFELTFETAPSEAICTQMIASANGDDSKMLVAEGCTKITFNADLSNGVTEPTADDLEAQCDSTPPGDCSVCLKTYVTPTSGVWADSDDLCAPGQICVTGNCQEIATQEPPATGNKCRCLHDGWDSYLCGANPTLSNCSSDADCRMFGTWDNTQGKCVTGTSCTDNSDCTSDEFCRYLELDHNTCAPATKGTCTPKAEVKGSFASGTTAEADGFILSNLRMDWYSAKNFCRSYGKNLVTLGQMGLGSCAAQGNASCQVSAEEWSAIQTKFGTNFIPFTAESAGPCTAFKVWLDENRPLMDTSSRGGSGRALCK